VLGKKSAAPSIKRRDPQARLFRLRCRTARLSQPHAGAAAVFVDELDAGGLKGIPQRGFVS
jgi:hypothetical protein